MSQALDEVAAKYDTIQTNIAIAWLIARPLVTPHIASGTSISQLDSLVNATKLKPDAESIRLLDIASAWN